MSVPEIVSESEWREARLQLLAAEKALTRQRDELNARRRRLPMVEVTKDYRFDSVGGPRSLANLFEGRSQLVVYHFMFDPDWDAGCPSCSFLIDNVGDLSHLHARDTTLAVVSRAPVAKIEAYRARMGWQVPWYSSYGSEFNYDFHVTIDAANTPVEYNYRDQQQLEADDIAWRGWSGEQPGTSVFLRHEGRTFHTYSSYARGGDLLLGTYNWLDLTPNGRQEDWEQPPGRSDGPFMGWLRRHDEYEQAD